MPNLPYLAAYPRPRFARVRPRFARGIALGLLRGALAWPPATPPAGPGHGDRAAGAHAGHKLSGKIAVFPIRFDDDHSISAQLQRLLRARGLEVVTDVRPVDTPEQYREVAGTLSLAALIGGRYDE